MHIVGQSIRAYHIASVENLTSLQVDRLFRATCNLKINLLVHQHSATISHDLSRMHPSIEIQNVSNAQNIVITLTGNDIALVAKCSRQSS